MVAATDEKLYKFHTENLRALKVAKEKVEILARRAMMEKDEKTLQPLIRLYGFLVGAWAEVRLKKVLYEPHGFSSAERKLVLSESKQINQWRVVVDLSFRKHFNLKPSQDLKVALKFTDKSRWEGLNCSIRILN